MRALLFMASSCELMYLFSKGKGKAAASTSSTSRHRQPAVDDVQYESGGEACGVNGHASNDEAELSAASIERRKRLLPVAFLTMLAYLLFQGEWRTCDPKCLSEEVCPRR